MTKLPTRRPSENYSIDIPIEGGNHHVEFSLSFLPSGELDAIIFTHPNISRGGIGVILDTLGRAVSKAIQGRLAQSDPTQFKLDL